ncbi:GNAT family N-acetyltransferase [Candidatus Dependentiae bacterium]|nr:GNAT family N-acetyltransferase [Candidatus Dependentiae bacterium]
MEEIRNITKADKSEILQLVKCIWGGEDYLPKVFKQWVDDSGFVLLSIDNSIAGVAKLTEFSQGEFWMEGLRVGKRYRGLGVAKRLTEYFLDRLLKKKYKTIMYATRYDNKASINLGKKYGFNQVEKFSNYHFVLRNNSKPKIPKVRFKKDYNRVYQYIKHSGILNKTNNMVPVGWKFRLFSRPLIKKLCEQNFVVSIGEIENDGFLIFKPKAEFEVINVLFLFGPPGKKRIYINYLLHLASLNKSSIGFTVPIYSRVKKDFLNAGFDLEWCWGIRLLEYQN